MSGSLRQSMSWLHTWTGLLFGWLLFVMFVTGACGYYRNEITLWMTPELHAVARNPVSDVDAARRAGAWLQANAANADGWTIELPDHRSPALRVSWRQQGAQPASLAEMMLDPHTGRALAVKPRATRGGDFLYRLHFDLRFIPPIVARYIVGVCAVVLLVALITGLIVHGHLFRDVFRFRPGEGRRAWLDAHNLASLLALPFHLAIAYSGLVCLMILLLPWGILSVYGVAGLGEFAQESFPQKSSTEREAGHVELQAIEVMVASASAHWKGSRVGVIAVEHPNDRRARVEITQAIRGTLSFRKPALVFDGATGQQIASINEDLSAVASLQSSVFGFHVGHFAGPTTRLLLFILGLAGAAMVATGLVLWSKTRRPLNTLAAGDDSLPGGLRLVDGLNAGIICGLPLAIAAYLWANRLVPVVAVERSEIEMAVFLWVWGGALATGLFCRPRWRWPSLLSAAGALLMLTPALNALTTSSNLVVTLADGPFAVAGIDLALVAAGAAFLIAARFAVTRTARASADLGESLVVPPA